MQLQSLLELLPTDCFYTFHIPSHLSEDLTDSPFEDWLARHNAHADSVAGLCNLNRGADISAALTQVSGYHARLLEAGRALRTLLFRIADQDQAVPVAGSDELPEEPEPGGTSCSSVSA